MINEAMGLQGLLGQGCNQSNRCDKGFGRGYGKPFVMVPSKLQLRND